MSIKLAIFVTASLIAFASIASAQAPGQECAPTAPSLPLPGTASGPPIDPTVGYAVVPLAPDVWLVTDGVYQAMFAASGSGVVVFDAPPSLAGKLSQAISSVTKEPVTHLVYSHSHLDHIGAAGTLGAKVNIVASRATAEKLRRFKDKQRPAPAITFQSAYRLAVGKLRVNLKVANSGHEPGSLYIHLPAKRILMAVDIVYPGWVPFTNLGMAQDVGLFVKSHDDLLAYDFDTFVGGHLGRAGTRNDVQIARDYAHDLIEAAEQARGAVDFVAIFKKAGSENKWLFAKTYMDSVADHCAKTMIAKWGAKLGGADVSTPGHCWVMQEFMNINGSPR